MRGDLLLGGFELLAHFSLLWFERVGRIKPSWPAVFALKFLQKSMIFTPCGPSAVPTGGAGVALPAAIWSFTTAATFFAIDESSRIPTRYFPSLRSSPPARSRVRRASSGRRS